MGHKAFSKRPRFIRMQRTRTHLLSYSILLGDFVVKCHLFYSQYKVRSHSVFPPICSDSLSWDTSHTIWNIVVSIYTTYIYKHSEALQWVLTCFMWFSNKGWLLQWTAFSLLVDITEMQSTADTSPPPSGRCRYTQLQTHNSAQTFLSVFYSFT